MCIEDTNIYKWALDLRLELLNVLSWSIFVFLIILLSPNFDRKQWLKDVNLVWYPSSLHYVTMWYTSYCTWIPLFFTTPKTLNVDKITLKAQHKFISVTIIYSLIITQFKYIRYSLDFKNGQIDPKMYTKQIFLRNLVRSDFG